MDNFNNSRLAKILASKNSSGGTGEFFEPEIHKRNHTPVRDDRSASPLAPRINPDVSLTSRVVHHSRPQSSLIEAGSKMTAKML